MDVPSIQSRYSQSKNVEAYSNLQELTADVEALKNDNFILGLKVDLYDRYLRKKCPSILIVNDRGVSTGTRDTMMSMAMVSLPSFCSSVAMSYRSHTDSMSSQYRPSHSLGNSLGICRVSPLFKIDIIDRELDESRIAFDRLKRRFESAKFLLSTGEENMRKDVELLNDAKVALESFLKTNTDKKTGRVVYDKYLRFLESELQNIDKDVRKMKLKTKSIQNEYNRLTARHEQRLELRERLHPIDLTKLTIETEELRDKLEQKTKEFMELKKTVGKKGQVLVAMKSKLNDTLLTLKGMRQDIKQKEAKYKFTEEKEVQNVNELITAEIINQNIKNLHSSYKSPGAHSYLMVQVRLNEFKSEREMWERRCKYQTQNITLLEHQVKQLYPPSQNKDNRSCRSSRTLFSTASADTMVSQWTRSTRTTSVHPKCAPTTPNPRIIRQTRQR